MHAERKEHAWNEAQEAGKGGSSLEGSHLTNLKEKIKDMGVRPIDTHHCVLTFRPARSEMHCHGWFHNVDSRQPFHSLLKVDAGDQQTCQVQRGADDCLSCSLGTPAPTPQPQATTRA